MTGPSDPEEVGDVVDSTRAFAPDYAVPPGLTLLEVLEDLGMTQSELAQRTALSTKHISQIAHARAPISVNVALRLERATGVPARVWNVLETRYQEHLGRIVEMQALAKETSLLEELPTSVMVQRGILTPRVGPIQRLKEVYEFFGVANREALRQTWGDLSASFRMSRSYEADNWAVAVWLREGELQAAEIDCEPFDVERFRSALGEVRRLTQVSDPGEWHPRLVELCAQAGVAVAVVDEVPRARTHGAARWLASDRALIQLSVRYRWSDIFWFSFFHEARHVLDQVKRSIVLESRGHSAADSREEAAADRFAADLLIPPAEAQNLKKLRSLGDVTEFAESLEVHPGIVVGRLQHEGLWRHSHGNGLRQRLRLVADQ